MDLLPCVELSSSEQGNTSTSNKSDISCQNFTEDGIIEADIRRTQEPALLHTNYWLAVIYLSIMTAALLIGTFGNVMILLVSACFRGVRRTGYQFIVNLALADLCVAAIADPMCVLAIVKGEAWFNNKPWLCTAVASMCITACFCAFFNLMMASLNRYVCICHHGLYYRIFTKRNCAVMCVGAWLAAFLAQFPNLVGWGDHGYDTKSHQCIWDRTASFSYTLIVSVGLIGTPLCIMGVSYFLTFRQIYSTKVNLYTVDKDDPFRVKKIWIETVKTSKILFVIFVFFVVLWVPYAVVISVDVRNELPVAMHLLVTMFAHLHSSVNCIVYIIGNRKFRLACLHLLQCTKCIRTESTANISESRSSGNAIVGGKVSTITGKDHFSNSTTLSSDGMPSKGHIG